MEKVDMLRYWHVSSTEMDWGASSRTARPVCDTTMNYFWGYRALRDFK